MYNRAKKIYLRGVTVRNRQRVMKGSLKEGAILLLLIAAMLFAVGEVVHAQSKMPPYWASLSVNEARMRVGPSLDYPSNWVYQRKDLPVRVLQIHGNWRKIKDETGTEGWMHVRLLSDVQTAIVTVPEGSVYEKRSESSSRLYRVERGVVGRVSGCADGWCAIDIGGKRGFIETDELWGAVN